MDITYIKKPAYSKQCGQTVLAMLTATSVKEICRQTGNNKLRNSDITRFLKENEIKHEFKRCRHYDQLPKYAIVKLSIEGQSYNYWCLKMNDIFYDPEVGTIKEYNNESIQPISYIKIEL